MISSGRASSNGALLGTASYTIAIVKKEGSIGSKGLFYMLFPCNTIDK